MEIYLTWDEIYQALDKLPEGKIFGVPRGGAILAGMTRRSVDDPEEADFILDDIIDSGRTQKAWSVYKKPFLALYHAKDQGGDWLHFPWEKSSDSDIEDHVVRMLQYIGEDATREGLKDTPARIVKSWKELFSGYQKDPKELFRTFEEGACSEMVILKDIEFYSTCEHHFLPFFGKINIGYIPNGKVIGISKLARLVEVFARRMQIQENLVKQIADTLVTELHPLGVIVIAEAQHFCMTARGVQKQQSKMVTSAIRGAFAEQAARAEFLSLTKNA